MPPQASSVTPPVPRRTEFARRIAAGDLRLYAILDNLSCVERGLDPLHVAAAWRDAGVRLIQYRDKLSSKDELRAKAKAVAEVFRDGLHGKEQPFLILNDRPDSAAACGYDGAHIGQADAATDRARAALGDDLILGISTHSVAQAESASRADVDYVAIGPVHGTTTKLDAEPVVGLCGVEAVRATVRKPLVAIGGITALRAVEILRAGADSVAVISAMLPANTLPGDESASLQQRAQDFLRRLK